MTTNTNKRKETNILFLKKDSNYNTSIQELNKISLNFHLNAFHKKYNSKTGRLYNNYNNISKITNYQNKNIEHSIIKTYIKTSSPNTNFKSSNIDISNSNNDLTNKIKSKDNNLSNMEYIKDLEYKKHFHHKKINSHLLIKNNQILNELFPSNTKSKSNKAKDSILNIKKKSGSKIIRKKHIQIDTYNINNNTNINNISKKLNSLSNNNQHKINLKIYLEKHQRVLSTDSNKNNQSIKINSKSKKYEKCQNKNNINSVIKNKRLITNKNSTRLLNNFNKNNTLSRANSSWINKEYNIFNTSLEHSISKNISNKTNNKVKINNVIIKNINNYMKEKKFKISDNIEIKKNGILNFDKLKEKTTLYYLTNISEEIKTKKKNYNNGNNIFISINNYTNDNKKKGNKSNITLTEGKDINIQNYISKKSISLKGSSKIRRRNYLKKNENKYKILGESKNSSQNKTEENFNSYNSENERIEGPELTHFFIVASIQKGIRNFKTYN